MLNIQKQMTGKSLYDISILVRVRNESVALERLLSFLQKQNFNGSFEVVVIDNESDDDSAKIALCNGARVFLLPRDLFTYGRAINIGVKRCQANLILLLSAHVWPLEENFLQSIFDDISNLPSIEGMYFRQMPYQVIGKAEKLRFSIFPQSSCVIEKDFVSRQLVNGLNLYDASYFSNSACILRRESMINYPMRDLPYAEENAFALDLIIEGKSVAYNNSNVVYYEGPVSLKRLYHQERRRTIAEKLLEKNYGADFGITPFNIKMKLSSVANVLLIPLKLLKIFYRILSKSEYKLGSRPLLYDVCSIGADWGNLIGILNWRKFEKTFELDLNMLEQANKEMKQL